MPSLVKRSSLSVPVVSAALLLIAGLLFGTNRSFGWFFIGLLVLAALFLLTLSCIVGAIVRQGLSSDVRLAVMLLVAAPFAGWAASYCRLPVLFLAWAASHQPELRRAMSTNTVIVRLDSWGMAGDENDAYLISDTADEIATIASAEVWRRRMRLDCPIAATRKIWPRLYIVTTSNCPFGDVALPSDRT